MDLDAYRASAEEFHQALDREYYRHYGGLQDEYEIERIYDRHRELFTRASLDALREHAARAPDGSEEHRRHGMLVDFAVEGYIGEATKDLEAELARREASLTLELGDGTRLGFREAATALANEPDADRRAQIEAARLELLERELRGLYGELIERQHACARELGWNSYREMCSDCKALDLDALHAQTQSFSVRTRRLYPATVEPELERSLGFGLANLRRSDLPRFFRAQEQDTAFPVEQLLASFEETMSGLGIDVRNQEGVVLDLEPRPKKSPRAFCAPVQTPGEVYLMLTPVGGREDFSVFFHEAGHTEHAAHVDPALPFEFRYLGDNAVTEAYAFLLQHLTENAEWLRRRLGIGDSEQLIAYARAQRLMYLRRYCAKLAYELELHGPQARAAPALADRYGELLGEAVQIEWPKQTFLEDVDPGFYCACYLRAWTLETHLRAHLRERFGPAWFEEPEAGTVLRNLWREGQRLTPEELLAELSGESLDFGVLLDDLALM